MKKKKTFNLIGALLILCTISIIIITNSCSKSTEPTEVVFTALPFAGVDYSLSFVEGMNNDGTIVVGGSALNTPDDSKYMEIPPVIWTDDTVTILPFPGPQEPFERQCAVYDISETGIMVGTQAVGDLTPLAHYYSNAQWHAIIDPATSANAQTASGISGDGNLVVGLSANAREHQGGYYYDISMGTFTILASTFGDSAEYSDTA